jgi:hypothetical protein
MEIKIREDEKYFYAGGNIYVEAGNSTRERRFHDHEMHSGRSVDGLFEEPFNI